MPSTLIAVPDSISGNEGELTQVGAGKLSVALNVWDPVGLTWTAMTQPSNVAGTGVTIVDGGDVTQGAKADAAWDGIAATSTVVGILKRVAVLLSSGGGGGPATIADGADVTQGAKADAAWDGAAAAPTAQGIFKYLGAKIEAVRALLAGTLTVNLPLGASTGAKQDTGNTSLASLDTKAPALGQALAGASVPVVLTAAQQAALTPPAALVGYALEAGHLAAIDTSTAKIPAQGQAVAASSLPVVLPAAQITTLTPPAAISGFALEGGHLASLDAHLPADPAREGGNLAAIAASTALSATAANQSTELTSLAAIAAALGGTPSASTPAPYGSIPDVLAKLGKKLDAHTTALAALVAAQPKPAPARSSSLLYFIGR